MQVKPPMQINEFCAVAGVSRAHVYREAKRGRLDLRKLGRRAVVTADEAARYLSTLPPADIEWDDRA